MKNSQTIVLILSLAVLFLMGTLGYSFVEGWTLFESLYMTVITLTTTGYQEVHQLSTEGRVFTIFLLVLGVSIFTIGLKEIFVSQLIISSETRRRLAMQNKINHLKEHIVICGFGRIGRVLCDELFSHKIPFVVIEKQPEVIHQLKELNYLFIEGDGTEDKVLEEANIKSARTLISVMNHDADVLYSLMAAMNMNPDIQGICRANTEMAKSRLLQQGARKIVLPMTTTAHSILNSILDPLPDEFTDVLGNPLLRDQSVRMTEIYVDESSSHKGQTIQECLLSQKHSSVVVFGLKKSDNQFLFDPPRDYRLATGDRILAMAQPK